MKKKLLAASISAGLAISAHAQSSVTLYGLVDEGFDFTNNSSGSKAYELQSGYVQGSRWGLKGVEDLGGQLKAVFQIENGFDVNTGRLGQGGLMFGRQAFVGLSSPTLGKLTLGRQYDSVVDYFANTTANGSWAGYLFSHPYDNDNADGTFRVNNTVKYTSLVYGGFQFGGTYSFSNDVNFANNRQYSIGAQYSTDSLLIAASYSQANNPSATAYGAVNNGGDENFVADRVRIFGVGINYTIGSATLGVAYSNTDVKNPVSSGYVGPIAPTGGSASSLRFQNIELNAKYQFTPAFYLGALYTYTRATLHTAAGESNPNYQTIGLMADYFLSKRTDVYLQGAYQHVGGDTTGSVLDVAYVPGANGVSSTQNQLVVRAAIRHKF
ncbi:putative porin [Paraburkholderia sp. BL18I3N2]|uniref:porin n=1 Tax=unclassified Paraburkholderia TaxID=2615204 RepID=UPI000D06A266|nr:MULTISPECIES: porin [unclassified Paraburkholderia]PRX19623.1 putative porin [Paraburkholderia sp. BL18I3N2]PRX95910.1 putative porin [Paraburkholderia sp. BL25I1N1]TDY15644.1 putative porin [Paraburkholderia sp. BL6665CI2N2]